MIPCSQLQPGLLSDGPPPRPALAARPGILLVGNFFGRAGTRWVCEDLKEHLAGCGWPVLATSRYEGRIARLLDMSMTAWRLRDRYAAAHIDVFSGKAFFLAEAIGLLLTRIRKPFVLTLHGGNLPGFARRWPGRVRRFLAGAAEVTTPSRYLREQMQLYRQDLRLLPNAINLAAYPCRLRHGLQPDFIWLRAFHEMYNPELAPQVLAELAPQFPGARLTMIGPDRRDGSRERTEALARRLGVQGRIHFTGGVPKADVPGWLDRHDIFLNTTNVDNTPISVIEAMASGLGLVSTRVGGIPYLLTHEQDALLVPPADAGQMAGAARRLLTDPALASSLSGCARRSAAQYDWPVVIRDWERLFLNVVAGATAVSCR